jgi:hypothetical protein
MLPAVPGADPFPIFVKVNTENVIEFSVSDTDAPHTWIEWVHTKDIVAPTLINFIFIGAIGISHLRPITEGLLFGRVDNGQQLASCPAAIPPLPPPPEIRGYHFEVVLSLPGGLELAIDPVIVITIPPASDVP